MNFSRIPRDVSRAFYILIRSRLYSRAAGTRMRQHPVPFRAACTYLRYGLFDLQSADFLCLSDLQSAYQTTFGLYPLLFYKETAFCLEFYSGFTRGEYRIAPVDFIVALRRTKGRGRRTLRSPPSPSSGLHLIHPGNPLRRGILAAAGLGQCR